MSGIAPPSPVRILVVDDHTIVRQGLRSILDLEADFTVVGEAPDAAQAVAETTRLRPDVVLLDLKLSDREPAEGLDVCTLLRERLPCVRIVVLTTFLDQKLLLGALQRGANAYVLKDVDAVELAYIIRSVHRGQSGFDGRSARLVVRSLTEQPAGQPPGRLGGRPTPPPLASTRPHHPRARPARASPAAPAGAPPRSAGTPAWTAPTPAPTGPGIGGRQGAGVLALGNTLRHRRLGAGTKQ